MQKRLTKILLIAAGSAALALGAVGIFLPILPTTPFLLLAGFCYMRSSEKLHRWLIQHKVFGSYIYNYMTYRAVTKKTKVFSVVLLWLGLAVSGLVVDNLHIRLVLAAVGLGVTIHVLKLRTLPVKEDAAHKTAEDGG